MSAKSNDRRHPPPSQSAEAELTSALIKGDPQRARALIEAGANMESVLRMLSHLGRFDAIRLLLNVGADKSQLEWTPLMEAVALGSIEDVRAALWQGAALENRDWWSRTAWLLAILTGDIAKAHLVLERGADANARGRCGRPPLFYAIQGRHPRMLRWLLRKGMDVDQADEFGRTALFEAVENDDLECVDMLLNAGANVGTEYHGTALKCADSRDVIMRLLDAGADPADANQRVILGLGASSEEALAAITPAEFLSACTRRFGETNPQQMNLPFWEAMIRCGASAWEPRRLFDGKGGHAIEAVWSADRFGQSLTLLPDGRAVQIGGEHEDSYDRDFCIHNDVFVHAPDGGITIYGYPEAAFPPTDFHTATLMLNSVYVIGSLGYHGSRRFGETQVYRLDLQTMRMHRVDAGGDAPGWIYKHRAIAVGSHHIRVWGGELATKIGKKESHVANHNVFVLDLERRSWHRETG